MLDLPCCTSFSPAVARGGFSPAAACRLLIALAPLLAKNRLRHLGLSTLQHVGPAVEAPGLQSTGSIVTLQFGNPLQCPCLENPMGRGAWWAAVHGAAESRTRLSGWQTGGRSCSTARGIFPDRGSNLCLLHWQADSLRLSDQGSPVVYILFIFKTACWKI